MTRGQIDEPPFRTGHIRKITKDGVMVDGDGWCLWLRDSADWAEPGHRFEMFGKGLGYEVRGLVIDGRVAWYETEDGSCCALGDGLCVDCQKDEDDEQ